MKVEVKGNQSQEVDWIKNPQLVADEHGVIVKVIVEQSPIDEYHFSGFCLNDDGYSSKSVDGWRKECFKPFHGEIRLKND